MQPKLTLLPHGRLRNRFRMTIVPNRPITKASQVRASCPPLRKSPPRHQIRKHRQIIVPFTPVHIMRPTSPRQVQPSLTIAALARRYGAPTIWLFGSNADGRVRGRALDLTVEGVAPARFFHWSAI